MALKACGLRGNGSLCDADVRLWTIADFKYDVGSLRLGRKRQTGKEDKRELFIPYYISDVVYKKEKTRVENG